MMITVEPAVIALVANKLENFTIIRSLFGDRITVNVGSKSFKGV